MTTFGLPVLCVMMWKLCSHFEDRVLTLETWKHWRQWMFTENMFYVVPLLFACKVHSQAARAVCAAWKHPWKLHEQVEKVPLHSNAYKSCKTLDSNSSAHLSHLYLLGWTFSLGSCTLYMAWACPLIKNKLIQIGKPLHMLSQTLFMKEVQTTLSTLDQFTASHFNLEKIWNKMNPSGVVFSELI